MKTTPWVAGEILKALFQRGRQPDMKHYRESRGAKIDLVIEQGGTLHVVECKSGATTPPSFFEPLSAMRDLVGACYPDPEMERPVFRGVVWDVDGTLIDSEPLHYEALLAVCGRYNSCVDEETNRALLGLSLGAVWDALTAAGASFATSRDGWMSEVVDYYVGNVNGSMARPGARQTVDMLAANGVVQAAVSTAERRIVLANLEAVGVHHAMQFAIAREDVARTKPDPDPYLTAAKRLALPPSQCVAVEDTPIGVASARAAGMFVVAFPNATTSELDFSSADLRVEHLAEVPWQELGFTVSDIR